MKKVRKHFTLEEECIKIITEVKKRYSCKSESEALEKVLKEYKEKNDTTTEMMIKIIAKEVAKELKGELTKLKDSMKFSDRNIQIILEMMNGMFIKEDYGDIMTLEEIKSEGYITAEKNIKDRISKNTVRKSYNEK